MAGALGEVGQYGERWRVFAQVTSGPLEDSTLEVESSTQRAVHAMVAFAPGRGTFDSAVDQRAHIASALGVHKDQLVFERLDDEGRMRLTIVQRSELAVHGLARRPRVHEGVMSNVAQYIDGPDDFAVSMWSAVRARMVPFGLVGDPVTGRSNAVRQLAAGALSTGAMQLMLLDPSGFREPELRAHACVALTGPEAMEQAWSVLDALVAARREHLAAAGGTSLLPTPEVPGWMIVFADLGAMLNSKEAIVRMSAFLRDSDRLGLWPVAVSGSVAPTEWGSQWILSRFSEQAVAFSAGTWATGAMGVDIRRATWPLDEVGAPVPGWSVPGFGRRRQVAIRWFWQPGKNDAVLCEEEAAARDAIARFRQEAALAACDADVLSRALGPAAAGRWDRGLA